MTTAVICLALNIYHEARGESLTGQHAVAQVTWNRAKHQEENVCRVVASPHQFSWTSDKLGRSGGKLTLLDAGKPKDKKSWEMAQHIAKITVMNYVPDFTRGATFYHANHVSPVWNKKLRLVSVIGAHRFYKFA